jgi:hypothetical protein
MAMRSLLKNPFELTHEKMVSVIADALLGRQWDVRREPIVRRLRPDLVVHRPEGPTYVIEVKQGHGGGYLGAVAQVEAYRDAVAQEIDGEAKGVLMIAGEVPEGLAAVAARAGVELVSTGSGDAGSLRDSLARWGAFGEPAFGCAGAA